MDVFSGAILSGVIYDIVKYQVKINADHIKDKLQSWIVGDSIANAMVEEINKLQISKEMSESAIEEKIGESEELVRLINSVKPAMVTNITQNHSGTGDNVAGDKKIKF